MEWQRVLIVEDSDDDVVLVRRALARGNEGTALELEQVQTAEAMRDALEHRGPWDVIICDWTMPSFSALAALALVRQAQIDVPFIVVSGSIADDAGVRAMRAGAHDYVLKSNLERLAPAIEREIREHRNRRARREAELRFQRLCDAGLMGVVVADMSDIVVDANDVFLTMVGYTREEMLRGALNWLALTSPEGRAESLAAKQALAAADSVPAFEKEYIHRSGVRVPVIVSIVRLDATRFLTVVMDLTARKRTEAALASVEEQLRQSQKMEAIGRLAGGIAHDFNNLLSVILTCSELLLDELPVHEPIREEVDLIHLAGVRGAALTRQILQFSRQQVVQPTVLDLNATLLGMEKMIRRALGEDVTLAIASEAATCLVRAASCAIEQVVMNLIVNARDAMPTGGKLTLSTANVVLDDSYVEGHFATKRGRYVMLSVTDTGTGMDRATVKRIFEPFFTTKETGKGTGLGLATVFGIVQQSGGHIWVYSEPGLGTTFKVYLPHVDGKVDATPARPQLSTLRGSETILLAEDDDHLRSATAETLRRHGYAVLEARNAGEAVLISEAHDGKIDLLLTDVVMPLMNGPTLANRLAASRPQMKILCMSGYADNAVTAFAHLEKPLTVESLTRKVREVLDAP